MRLKFGHYILSDRSKAKYAAPDGRSSGFGLYSNITFLFAQMKAIFLLILCRVGCIISRNVWVFKQQVMEEKEMKKTVKTLAVILALVMLLTAASACGRNPKLKTVEQGVLIMATNAEFPPYEFWEGNEIIGIDAEIAGAIAAKLGLKLKIEDIEFTQIIAAVTGGRVDMGMAGMTVTEDRMKNVNFSTSYATGVQVIIVKEGSPITSVDDLFADDAHFNIGVQESTTGDIYTSDELEDEGLATIFRYNRGADAVQALVTGRVDCVVIDNEPAKAFVAMNPGLIILDTEYAVEDYAIAFNKGSKELLDAVDKALRELISDGTVKKIIDKYISAG